jgi:hypothetical protein
MVYSWITLPAKTRGSTLERDEKKRNVAPVFHAYPALIF